MLEKIEFPHDLLKTFEVILWFHLHPEECKEAMEVFLTLDGVDYKLVGKTSQVYCNVTRVCLAEHQYGGDGNRLCEELCMNFQTAIRNLHMRRSAFQTCTYRTAPYLFTAYIWSLESLN
jgi:hypothetical protein